MKSNLHPLLMLCVLELSMLFVACTEPEEEPKALFSYSQKGTTVKFTNASHDTKSYVWDFGDSETSTEENPVHTYTKAGEFIVVLTATNVTKTKKYSQTITISQTELEPIAKFSYEANELTVAFKNASTNGQSYKWDFGDGKTSTDKDPTYTYSKSGTYKVTLTAINGEQSNNYAQDITVTEQTPKASFTYSKNNLSVSFINTSTNAKSYKWEFGDGKTSTDKNPNHTYTKEGTYSVTLTVTNVTKSNKTSKSITLQLPVPKASFTYTTQAPLTVIFSNKSTNATTYEWDFGDGSTSTDKNPTHRYSTAQSYMVTLVAKNANGSSEYRETIKLTAPKVYVKGIEYETIGQQNKYYKSVCEDDDFFSNTWWNTSYTPLLNDSKLPYQYIFSSPVELTGLDGDNYYTVYVYWNNTTSGNGTQILKQKMYTSEIKEYPGYIWLINDNISTSIKVLLEYK